MKRKTVLITGASRGIGRAIALQFMTGDYNLILNCFKNIELLENLKQLAAQKNIPCLCYAGDMGDYTNVEELFSLARSNFGGVDILINNAGISYIGLITDMSVEEWHTILQTNLSSAFYCSKLATPYMVGNKYGKIINISSVWGGVGASMEVAYSTTKGAMNAMTKALAKELAPSNVQVNAIACGAIDTEMNHFLEEEDLAALISEIPSDRLGRPEEVAELVLQLCEGPSYLTGQIIGLDGGWI